MQKMSANSLVILQLIFQHFYTASPLPLLTMFCYPRCGPMDSITIAMIFNFSTNIVWGERGCGAVYFTSAFKRLENEFT